MNCYKCLSETELSLKKRRMGGDLLICRACRRAEYHAKKHLSKMHLRGFTPKFRQATNDRLMEKYAKI